MGETLRWPLLRFKSFVPSFVSSELEPWCFDSSLERINITHLGLPHIYSGVIGGKDN